MLTSTFVSVVFASSLACLVTTIGIFIIGKYEKWGNQNVVYFMSFAAGVLITVSIMHILPEAYTMNTSAPLFVLVGYWSLHL